MEIFLSNSQMHVRLDEGALLLSSPRGGAVWRLDAETILGDDSGDPRPRFSNRAPEEEGGGKGLGRPFTRSTIEPLDERTARWTLRGPAGQMTLQLDLTWEGLRITLLAGSSTVTAAALPGAFRPDGEASPAVILPRNQGVWHRGTGPDFCFHYHHDGHAGWSMPFFAVVGAKESLLTIMEDEHDARIWFEKTPAGQMRATCIQDPARGRLGYDRRVLLRFVEPTTTAVTKSFREYVRDRGTFRSWEEKIAERPNLRKLFGALMCFIGYCRNDRIDYAAGFRRLKAMGFDKAYVYPLAMSKDGLRMAGLPSVDLRQHIPLLDELGYLSSSWMWLNDGPEDPAINRLEQNGKPCLSWKIDDQRWYHVCTTLQVAIANQVMDAKMRGHSAQHFDVTCSAPPLECYHPDHPLDRRGEVAWRKELLGTATRRGMVVAAEGFWGCMTPHYDIATVKIPLPVYPHWYTVPLTSLVYHDSCVHDWWEVDNYNNPHHRLRDDRNYFPLRQGGSALFQSLQDALAGWPPNVFPFGTQYGWVDQPLGDTYAYTYSLEDAEVQEALRLALPIARLHGRVGRCECRSHRVLTPDGSVQTSEFADGTGIAVNYSSQAYPLGSGAMLEPRSWREL